MEWCSEIFCPEQSWLMHYELLNPSSTTRAYYVQSRLAEHERTVPRRYLLPGPTHVHQPHGEEYQSIYPIQ